MYWSDAISLEPVYEIPKANGDGYTNRITLSRAKDLDLLPRVTGIINAVLGDSYSIGKYRERCNILAAEHMMRADEEHDDDYIERVSHEAGSAARASRKRGNFVHGEVSNYLIKGQASADPAAAELIDELSKLLHCIGAEGVTSERSLGGRRIGYVGTPDIYIGECDARDLMVWLAAESVMYLPSDQKIQLVIDLKTTDLRKFKKPYREHLYQFGGYGNLLDLGKDAMYLQWYADPWTGESKWVLHQDTERWKEAFNCLYRAWLIETGFDQPNY